MLFQAHRTFVFQFSISLSFSMLGLICLYFLFGVGERPLPLLPGLMTQLLKHEKLLTHYQTKRDLNNFKPALSCGIIYICNDAAASDAKNTYKKSKIKKQNKGPQASWKLKTTSSTKAQRKRLNIYSRLWKILRFSYFTLQS